MSWGDPSLSSGHLLSKLFSSIQSSFMLCVFISSCSLPTSLFFLPWIPCYVYTELHVVCFPIAGPLNNKLFSLTGTLFSFFFSHPLFSFGLAICCSSLDRAAFRNHWLAAHPEEVPCPGVYRAPSTFPQALVALLTTSWLAHFPSPLSCEVHKLRNYDLLPNLQCLEQGLVHSTHPINACSVIKQFIEWLCNIWMTLYVFHFIFIKKKTIRRVLIVDNKRFNESFFNMVILMIWCHVLFCHRTEAISKVHYKMFCSC